MRSPGGSPVALARIETPESTSTPRAQGRKRRNRLVFFRGVPFWPRIRPGKRIPIPAASAIVIEKPGSDYNKFIGNVIHGEVTAVKLVGEHSVSDQKESTDNRSSIKSRRGRNR